MDNNLYNDNKEHKELINLLKQLPKIKTDDNFEFNLMTRIQNKNFDSRELNKKQYSAFGFFKPALAVIASAVILFFVMDNPYTDIENPLIAEPEIRTELSAEAEENAKPQEFIVDDNSLAANHKADANKLEENDIRLVLKDNDVIAEEKVNFPFPDKSFSLDNKLNSNTGTVGNESRVLAGTGYDRVQFEGFYTRPQLSQRILDSLRNLDSLNRSKLQIDSSTKR